MVVLLLFILVHALRLFALPFTFCTSILSEFIIFLLLPFYFTSLIWSKLNTIQGVSLKCIHIAMIWLSLLRILCIITAVNLASSHLFSLWSMWCIAILPTLLHSTNGSSKKKQNLLKVNANMNLAMQPEWKDRGKKPTNERNVYRYFYLHLCQILFNFFFIFVLASCRLCLCACLKSIFLCALWIDFRIHSVASISTKINHILHFVSFLFFLALVFFDRKERFCLSMLSIVFRFIAQRAP